MKLLTYKAKLNNPNIDECRKFYGINCFSVETHYHISHDGKIIYRHILSGNSPQPTRVYDTKTGKDYKHNNHAFLYYLTKIKRLSYHVKLGYYKGSELQ